MEGEMKLSNLSKTYGGRTLFSSLSFSIERGIVQLCGPSGCGKSTLIRLCLGLERPTEGEVSYGDFSFAKKTPKEIASFRAERLGYCGDGSSLLYSFSLKANISRLLPEAKEDRKKDLCARLSFSKLDKPLSRLSGGERHKAELIFTFLSEKETLFLDEPFSALDPQSKGSLVSLINEYAEDHLVVLVNHDVGVEGLALSLKVDVPSGKTETLLEAQPGQESPEKRALPKKRSVVSFFLCDFLKSFRFELAAETVLIVGSFLSLLFGLACYPSRDALSAGKMAMENDPLSSFALAGTKRDQHAELDAFVREKADTACYFSGNTGAYRIILAPVRGLPSDTTLYVDKRYGDAPSSVALSGQPLAIDDTYEIPSEKENYYLLCTREKKGNPLYGDDIYFVSPSFADSFFLAGGFPALSINGQAGEMPKFLYCGGGEVGFASWTNGKPLATKIQGGSTDVLLLPGFEAASAVPFHKVDFGVVGPNLKASGSPSEQDTAVMSPDYYRYLSYLYEQSLSSWNRGLLPSFGESDALTFLQTIEGSGVTGVIQASYSYSESIGNLLLAVGAGLLAFYLLLVGFSAKGKRAYFRNTSFFLSLQGFSSAENAGLLTAPFAAQGLLAEGLGLLFYGACFIPVVNNILYQSNHLGSYVKSMSLEEYAAVKAPLPFEDFNALAYLSFAVLLVVYGLVFIVLSHRERFLKRKE
jgi:ABC-type lipoprotein export system ATPase subunit